ncbi:nitroreductase family protein [Paenibacillus sp. 481]|uniref:nitroreductase family protein n=1 Tax=Paenibacillus sp. 481 TaxID=2835869 RepID=UPI001E50DD33|nr:nitroreductase [Paenibacillus sp. 481]UHA72097.1 nitroreductase [Paenibacillus sp. 481]
MSIASVVRNRRSIHHYNDKPVERELILRLLDDAVWAPNHGMREPWRFIYADGNGKKRLVDGLIEIVMKTLKFKAMSDEQREKFKTHAHSVPAYLIVVMPEDARPAIWEEDLAAVSSLIQNFQLLAWEEGIGMLWHTGDYIYNKDFRELAGVQPGEKIVGVLRLGYFDETPAARPRTPAKELFTVLE